MKLTALIAEADEVCPVNSDVAEIEILEITYDSRGVRPGTLFVALDGAQLDGHRFVADAVSAGAAAVLVDRARAHEFNLECPVLQAENTREALGPLAAAFFEYPSDALSVVGVTGTNGKTTITWILDALFAATDPDSSLSSDAGTSGRDLSGVLGTIEYRWGNHREPAENTTPESLVVQRVLARMRQDGVKRVAMEVSSHGLTTHRLGGTHFDVAIFSNLTQDHLDFHGDMEAYRAAKARLFGELLPESKRSGKPAHAVINLDDPAGAWFAGHARQAGVETVTFGQSGAADWRAEDVEQTLGGAKFGVCGPAGESFRVDSPLMGTFNVSNVLAAVVAARLVGVSVAQIQAGLRQLKSVPGRMQRVLGPGAGENASAPAVFVDYAHTPDALMRALQTARALTAGRLVVVFGCGGDRDRKKRAPMGKIAAELADICLVTSDNPRNEPPEAIIEQILVGVDQVQLPPERLSGADLGAAKRGVRVEPDRARAIAEAVAAAGPDDVVLIAGKGHETYQERRGARVDFDDAKEAKAALVRRAPRSDDGAAAPRISTWSLQRIAEAVGGRLQFRDPEKPVDPATRALCPTAVSTDTRKLAGGELFVALRGDNFDAHDFLDRAKNAVAIVVDRLDSIESELPLIVVDDTLQALSRLGHAVWREANLGGLKTINVTGSNGKTTVKELLALLWRERGTVFATPGNLNNHIGVPLVLCAIPIDCEYLILEMGANAAGEISQLVALAPGEARIVTSIGLAHIEGFGSLDGIRRAKSEIFEPATAQTLAIVPFSEAKNLISADFPGQVVTVGFEEGADYRVELGARPADGALLAAQAFRLHFEGRTLSLRLPIPGKHHALNAATAIATLTARGALSRRQKPARVDENVLNTVLGQLNLPGGRWRRVEIGDICFIDDAYNANPSSTVASAEAFIATADPRERPRVVVLGEMRELGPETEKIHREVAARVAGFSGLDALVSVGAYAGQMTEAAREALAENSAATPDALEVVGLADAASTARWLREFSARRGAPFVLLKASRGARLETVIDLVASTGEKHRGEKPPRRS